MKTIYKIFLFVFGFFSISALLAVPLFSLSDKERKFIESIESHSNIIKEKPLAVTAVYTGNWDRICIFGRNAYKINGDVEQKERIFGKSFAQSQINLPDTYSYSFRWGFSLLKGEQATDILKFGLVKIEINNKNYEFGGVHPNFYLKNSSENPTCFSKDKAVFLISDKSNRLYLGEK